MTVGKWNVKKKKKKPAKRFTKAKHGVNRPTLYGKAMQKKNKNRKGGKSKGFIARKTRKK